MWLKTLPIIFAFITCIGEARAAEWWHVAQDRKAVYLIDVQYMKIELPAVSFSILVLLQDTSKIDKSIQRYKALCTENKITLLTVADYDTEGSLLYEKGFPEDYIVVVPKSLSEVLFRFACASPVDRTKIGQRQGSLSREQETILRFVARSGASPTK